MARGASAATITVTGTGDTIAVDGIVTLREAITSIKNGANLNADVVAVGAYGTNDTINFGISGAGVHTIKPATDLPAITKTVLIDGYTQPGASANTLAVGDNALLLIEIDGTNINALLTLQGPNGGSTIRGLVLNHLTNGPGVNINSSPNNTITGNFIGVDPTGTTASGGGTDGIDCSTASGTVVGGTTPAARNVMSSGGAGVSFGTCSNGFVQGNYVGINAAGTGPL